MNRHLGWDEISEYLAGGGAPAHAQECGECRKEVERVEAALTEFRGATRNWSERVSRNVVGTSVVVNTGIGLQLNPRRGMYAGNGARAGLGSLAVHMAMAAGLLWMGTLKPVQVMMMTHVVPLIAPPPARPAESHGGGGGGARQPEAKKAELPRPAPRQFVAPRTDPPPSRLQMPAVIESDLPIITSNNIGAPEGLSALNGPGLNGGIGTGPGGGGVGVGVGPGTGEGGPGGYGGGKVYSPGGEITKPVPIFQPEPQYSEEARKERWEGKVLLSLVVDETGHATRITVLRPLGLGLDQKAIEAVSKWLFKPGTKNGKPVKVWAEVEVSFRLL